MISPDIIEQIVSAIGPREGEIIVEIGPGRGAITEALAESASELHVVELDRDLVGALRSAFEHKSNVTVHEANALQFDFSALGQQLRVVGNLPYNISTPLLFHLLGHSKSIVDAVFMLQREVVERICASPGSKDYGRLTVMLGCRIESTRLFDVPPESFSPPPKVMSSVVHMRPLPEGQFDVRDPEILADLVRLAFSRRRKTLRNAVEGIATRQHIEDSKLDPGHRPEQISTDGWIALSNRIADQAASD